MRILVTAITVAITFLAGCSSQILVTEIPPNPPAGSEIDGIPFRVPKRFTMVIYEKQTGKGYVELVQLPVTIADPDRLYILNFNSQVLSNSTLDVTANPDNTLQQISLKSTSTGAAAITSMGSQISSVSVAQQTQEKTAALAETSAANRVIAAKKAQMAADFALLQYDLLLKNPGVPPQDLMKALHNYQSALLDANEAARLAGKP